MPKKKKVAINWSAVEEAMARSARGHGSHTDFDVCMAAFNADRKKYSEVSSRVRAGVQRSMNPLLADKDSKD